LSHGYIFARIEEYAADISRGDLARVFSDLFVEFCCYSYCHGGATFLSSGEGESTIFSVVWLFSDAVVELQVNLLRVVSRARGRYNTMYNIIISSSVTADYIL
jgi:hypothetical protein